MLDQSAVEANIPAADLDRARAYYSDKLGLTPIAEFPGEQLRYQTKSGTFFNLYRTQYAGMAGHTIAQWHVADVDQEVRDLRMRCDALSPTPPPPPPSSPVRSAS